MPKGKKAVVAANSADIEVKSEAVGVPEASTPDPVVVATPPVVEVKPKTVKLISAIPGKQIEVSIGRDHWKGVEIEVPAELEGEIRRILEAGGYYLKN